MDIYEKHIFFNHDWHVALKIEIEIVKFIIITYMPMYCTNIPNNNNILNSVSIKTYNYKMTSIESTDEFIAYQNRHKI